MTWEKELKLKQVDKLINTLKPKNLYKKPHGGWLQLIRTTLAMSAKALGEKVGLSQSRIALIEKGEVEGTITLNTLEKVADGLECEVVYFLVPRNGSLANLRRKQAYLKAKDLDSYTELHMSLENQATSKEYQNESIKKLQEEYLKNWSYDFWNKI